MVYVILRTGKVLRYNDATQICVEEGTITLRKKKGQGKAWLLARFPLDVVERAEFDPPCKQRYAGAEIANEY